jgi:hypothetical protein
VELEMADDVGAGLEQQLRGGIQQHAGRIREKLMAFMAF